MHEHLFGAHSSSNTVLATYKNGYKMIDYSKCYSTNTYNCYYLSPLGCLLSLWHSSDVAIVVPTRPSLIPGSGMQMEIVVSEN